MRRSIAMKMVCSGKFICGLLLLLVSTGCGYTFQGSGSVLPPDVKRIYIPRVENNSAEFQLTSLVTESLRDRFERFGVVAVVDELGDADAVLRARILKIKRNTATSTSKTDTALQVDTTMTFAAELRRVSGPVLWRNTNLAVTKSFGSASAAVVTTSPQFAGGTLSPSDLASLEATGTREVARGQESEAFNQIADEAARIVYDAAVAPDF